MFCEHYLLLLLPIFDYYLIYHLVITFIIAEYTFFLSINENSTLISFLSLSWYFESFDTSIKDFIISDSEINHNFIL